MEGQVLHSQSADLNVSLIWKISSQYHLRVFVQISGYHNLAKWMHKINNCSLLLDSVVWPVLVAVTWCPCWGQYCCLQWAGVSPTWFQALSLCPAWVIQFLQQPSSWLYGHGHRGSERLSCARGSTANMKQSRIWSQAQSPGCAWCLCLPTGRSTSPRWGGYIAGGVLGSSRVMSAAPKQ